MLRIQRKLPLWRRFGYVILIIIKFGELLLWFSSRIIDGLRSYIKHLKGCFIPYPNTLKLVKKTRHLVFSTTSWCLDIKWNTLPHVWYITSSKLKYKVHILQNMIHWFEHYFSVKFFSQICASVGWSFFN